MKTWPTKENNLALFAGTFIIELGDCFGTLLERNGCKTDLLLSEWITLKIHMIPIVKNNPDEHHLYLATRFQIQGNTVRMWKHTSHY